MVSKLLTGFDVDCKKLIVAFEKESSVRFSIFAEIWKGMKFTLIFSGRPMQDLIVFINEALVYVNKFFFHTNSFLRKVCCIYILYGMYYKQPIKDACKICITLKDWMLLKEFISTLKENNHLDALYITLKLVLDNAFHFSILRCKILTAIPNNCVLEDENIVEEDLQLDTINTEELIEQLSEVETEYERAKLELSASLNIPKIKYSRSNLGEILKNILQSTNMPGCSKDSDNNILKRRRDLKNRQFSKKFKDVKSFVLDKTNSDDELRDRKSVV